MGGQLVSTCLKLGGFLGRSGPDEVRARLDLGMGAPYTRQSQVSTEIAVHQFEITPKALFKLMHYPEIVWLILLRCCKDGPIPRVTRLAR
jgi:hypothetical protein